MVWLRNLLDELGFLPKQPIELRIDNTSAIRVSKNPEHHGRMKHLDIRHFWLRDAVQDGKLDPVYISTDDQVADLLTKSLPVAKIEKFRTLMGLTSPPHA